MKNNIKILIVFLIFGFIFISYSDYTLAKIDVNNVSNWSAGNNGVAVEDYKMLAPKGDVINFAAAADQHYGQKNNPIPDYDKDTVIDWMTDNNLPEFDFVIASMGDWISDNGAGPTWTTEYIWEKIVENNADYQMNPYFYIFGNHDITNYEELSYYGYYGGNPVYRERLGRSASGLNENNYAFMYNNVLFISAAQTSVLYTLSQYQKNWLEYLVKRYSNHTTVILTHQAMYETTGKGDERSTSWTDNDYRVYNDVDWWHDFLDNNSQIKMYIHGHTEKGVDTIVHDLHAGSWDDDCTFVLVPSNGRDPLEYNQNEWSYIFTITDDEIVVKLWDSLNHIYMVNSSAGVPYARKGNFNVKDKGLEWFSIPKKVLDGQEWEWKNRMLAKNYNIELIGSDVTEQIDNPELDGCDMENESSKKGYWYAVGGEDNALNLFTGEYDGYIKINGENLLELSTSGDKKAHHVEGKVPYNTALAIPGKTYEFKARIKTVGGNGSADILIDVPEELTLDNFTLKDFKLFDNVIITNNYQNFSKVFTLPNNGSMWFIKPKIYFNDSNVTYQWDSWSLKMVQDNSFTEDFTITLNGDSRTISGYLLNHEYGEIPLPAIKMNNTLNFKTEINGNKVGMVRLIYEDPQLWSDDVSFGVRDKKQTKIYIEDVSPYNNHTTIMSFKDVKYGIKGLYTKSFNGKNVYLSPLYDGSINGVYNIIKLK
jgi:hypothetical protein